jgi:hypothetical protein
VTRVTKVNQYFHVPWLTATLFCAVVNIVTWQC